MSDFAEIIARVIDALEVEAESHWIIGASLLELPDTRGAAKAVAGEVGRSASWVSEHRRTAAAFPQPESRAQDLSWGHHVICARTKEPERWIESAVAEQLSTRQLKTRLVEQGVLQTRERSGTDDWCGNCRTLLKVLIHVREILGEYQDDYGDIGGLYEYVDRKLKEQARGTG